MKYIIFFSILLLIFLLYEYAMLFMPYQALSETFESNPKKKKDKAKSGGFMSRFVETKASANEKNSKKGKKSTKPKNAKKSIVKKTADKLDYSKGLSNLDIQYHDSPEKIAKDEGINLETVSIRIYDPIKKKVVTIKRPAIQNSATYYEPGTYKYGASKYVPNYTESVLLSTTNNYFTDKSVTAPAPPKFDFYNINAVESGMSTYKPGE